MSDEPLTEQIRPSAEPDVLPGRAELDELRQRVAAQDRLIEAILAENEDIHALRRRNHQLEQYVGRILGVPGVRKALEVRRRLLGRSD